MGVYKVRVTSDRASTGIVSLGVTPFRLDLPTQDQISRTATAHLAAWKRFGAQQVAVMMVRRGGRPVLADVTSAGATSQPGGAIDYTTVLRSPGSTLKPLLYVLPLQRDVIAPQDVLANRRPADEPGAVDAGVSNACQGRHGRRSCVVRRRQPGSAAADRRGRGPAGGTLSQRPDGPAANFSALWLV